jgi:type I restriction enzyme S subunit
MTPAWNLVQLGDVCGLQNGFAFKSKLFKPSGMPVLRISSIQDELVCDNRPVFTDPEDYKEDLSKYKVQDGDLLIAMSGATTGKVGFNRTGKTFLLNQRVGKFEPSPRLNIDYLFYFLSTIVEENLAISAGSAQPNLSTKQIKDFAIPLPPLPEQKRIVAILDEAFAGIDAAVANTEKNLANARELFESYLNTVFTRKGDGWVEKTLGEICDLLGGFAFKSTDAVTESNVQLIRMGNLYQNVLDLNRKPSFYPENFADEYSRYILSEGDLIISLTGTVDKEDYGYTVEIPATDRALLLNQRIAKFINISKEQIARKFFLHFLRSRTFLDELYGSARGVRQANLSSVSMKKLTVAFPNLEEQKRLVDIFDMLEDSTKNLEIIYQQKLTALAELKQSILQKAFAGELTATPDKVIAEAVA